MKSKLEIITPEMAIKWLENNNPKNRTISEGTVQSYANDMKNGRWVITHQGIAFNANGDLIDGQHRLWGIVIANKPVEMMVTTGMPLAEIKNGVELVTMDTIDNGRVRYVGQQLQLCHGVKNGNAVAAAIRGIVFVCHSGAMQRRISTANSLVVYELYGKHIEAIIEQFPYMKQRTSNFLSTLAMYHKGEPERAIQFCNQLYTMENMEPAVRTLRKYLEINNPGRDQEKGIRVTAYAVQAFHNKREITKMSDCQDGIKFLSEMFPSTTKRIRDSVRPLTTTRVADYIKQKKNGTI